MSKLLTFDLGGVCFFTNLSEMNRRFTKDTGVSFRPLNGGTYSFYYELDRGEITVDDYFKALKDVTGSKREVSYLKEAYRRFYLETSSLNFPLLTEINKIRKKYRAICASTTNRFHEQINRERGMFDYFDALYFSHEIGLLGMDFLKGILSREELCQEVIMIDNDVDQIRNGKKIGIDTILFQDNEQLFDELKKRGIYE